MKKLVLIIFSLISCTLWSQEPVSIHLTQKDGLPDIEFYDIIEDNEGFIWLAADKGLFRYNGKEYKNYSHHQKRGLSVFNLKKDAQGRIWCNNVSGQFFYIHNDSLKLYIDIQEKIEKTKLPIYTFDETESLCIATDGGLYHVDKTTKEIRTIIDNKTMIARQNHELVNFDDHIYFMQDSLYVFKNRKLKKRIPTFTEHHYVKMFRINQKNYYVGSNRKWYYPVEDNELTIAEIDLDSGSLKPIEVPKELKGKTIIEINEIDGKVYVITNGGCFIYRVIDGNFLYEGVFNDKVYSSRVIKDLNENYWITTLEEGVDVIPNLGISKLRTDENIHSINALEIVESKIIYGTEQGYIGVKDLITQKEKLIKLGHNVRVFGFAYNPETNSLFVSTDNRSILWDFNTGKVFEISGVASKDINLASNNNVLISYHSGAMLVDFSHVEKSPLSKESIFQFRPTKKHIRPLKLVDLSNVRSYANHYKNDDAMYVGQIDHLYHIDKNLKKTEITFQGNSLFATDITETKDGTIWISTNEFGILGIQDKKVVFHYDESKGLQSNQTLKLVADENDLWVITNEGLHFLDRRKEAFKSFSFQHEIPIQKVKDIKPHKGKLYIGGDTGIFVVDKKYIQEKEVIPTVYFESVLIGNSAVEKKEKYVTSYDQNSFEAYFNSNTFNSKESITYLYRLEGLEKDWTPTSTGSVRFPSLPYGRYTFQIKAVTNKGVESEVAETIAIEVTKPFWVQWWFYLLLLILLFIYYKVTLSKIQKKQQIKIENERVGKELVLSQLENLRSQMNPHFIFNVLNSIQEYIISNDKYTASLYLTEFSKLIRMYLEHSRREEINLDEELKALKIYLDLEKDRFEEDFEYSIHLDTNVNKERMTVPSLFIQPYVENAIKHGLLHKEKNKIVSINFIYDKKYDQLICKIVDNGIGRKESEKINEKKRRDHKSFATKAIDNRVDLLNKNRERKIRVEIKDLETENQESEGTRITITIPQ